MVIMEQSQVVLNRHLGNETVNGASDGQSLSSAPEIESCCGLERIEGPLGMIEPLRFKVFFKSPEFTLCFGTLEHFLKYEWSDSKRKILLQNGPESARGIVLLTFKEVDENRGVNKYHLPSRSFL